MINAAAQTPEAEAFARYKALFDDAVRIGEDLKQLNAEFKNSITGLAAIKRLARLAARDSVSDEAIKHAALKNAAIASGQSDLFAMLDMDSQ